MWRASLHSMWVTPHSLSMQSCPTGATLHDFLCGVAPCRATRNGGYLGILQRYTCTLHTCTDKNIQKPTKT